MKNVQSLGRISVAVPSIAMAEIQLPVALSRALVEFGLLSSFRASDWSRQMAYARAVVSAPALQQPERIAEVLDELALGDPLYHADVR